MLSGLTLSGLDLDPAFAFGTMTYTAASTAASTTVTATRYESTDRLSVRKGRDILQRRGRDTARRGVNPARRST